MILLEMGPIRGFISELVVAIGAYVFVASCVIALIIQFIHNYGSEEKFTKKQYWMVVLACMSIAAIIFGFVCL